jgi:gas vesicle protein
MTKKKSEMSVGKAAVIGAGVVAASAGAYYLLGPKGKQHQKKAKIWMAEIKTEVEKELKKVKSVTKPLYQNTVDAIATTYSKQYKEHANEINAFAKKLKGEWKSVQSKALPVVKAVKK